MPNFTNPLSFWRDAYAQNTLSPSPTMINGRIVPGGSPSAEQQDLARQQRLLAEALQYRQDYMAQQGIPQPMPQGQSAENLPQTEGEAATYARRVPKGLLDY